jgi:hypothetical protein
MSPEQLLIVVAIVGYVLVRRFVGQPLQPRALLLPLAVTIYGAYQLRGHHLSGVDVALIGIEVVVALAVGLVRGTTIQIFTRDGHLWWRYRLVTLLVWVAGALLRFGLATGGHLAGADLDAGGTLLLMLGVSLVAETAVVGVRAARTGVPFAPDRRGLSAGPVGRHR